MTDPKKEEQHSSQQGAKPDTVLPEGTTYPTPELNPDTGAPIDPRFQNRADASQEATASQQSPKSGGRHEQQSGQRAGEKPAPQVAEQDDEAGRAGRAGRENRETEDDEAKGKDKARPRR